MGQIKVNDLVGKAYEWLLYAYIIIAPINSYLVSIGQAATITYLAMVLLAVGLCSRIAGVHTDRTRKFGGIYIVAVLLAELALMRMRGMSEEVQCILTLMCFCLFLSVRNTVSIKRVYIAFYVATIIGGLISATRGTEGGTVTRTAVLVDGSLAVITMAIILFAKQDFRKGIVYKGLRFGAIAGSILVAGFGMSRARLALLAVMFAVRCIMAVRRTVRSGYLQLSGLLWCMGIVLAISFALNMTVVEDLLEEVGLRFSSGFEDAVRDGEMEVGMIAFRQNRIFGYGWHSFVYRSVSGTTRYYNHCMYVAVLARGGLLLAVPMLITLTKLWKWIWRCRDFFCIITFMLFLLLAYGNAGLFNYTICSMFIPLRICMQNAAQTNKKNTEREVLCR